MGREVRLSHIDSVLEDLNYPVTPDEAATTLDDVTLQLADGEANLGSLVADLPADSYESSDELQTGLHTTLPRSAVGEPFQSEGDG